MSNSFSARLSALRKEQGISQKQAAADLGVSQALLSHYEKGIRECGLAFLCRCAVYYGVSSDYLLALSDSRQESAQETSEDILSPACIGQTARLLEEGDAAQCGALSRMYSILLYKTLLVKAAGGALPREWVPRCKALHSPVYLAQINALCDQLLREVRIPASLTQNPKQAPACLQTLVRETQEYVRQAVQRAAEQF